jgi:transketolase
MRKEFTESIVGLHADDSRTVLITGDLGYLAFEGARTSLGENFINAGVAEQNMVTMAAGMAYEGFIPWVYSISPFVTLRPFEQIRNDVCLHSLPVKLVGNGGGYGYGIMGSTHHNLEDIGALRMLPNMQVYVPFVSEDVAACVRMMAADPRPNYLRLNTPARSSLHVPPFAPWRHLQSGSQATVVGTGPVLQNLCSSPEARECDIWVTSLFPLRSVPDAFVQSLSASRRLITIEEHTSQGGLAETLALMLTNRMSTSYRTLSLTAAGYPSGTYGSQAFHQNESSLGGPALNSAIASFLSTNFPSS